jgi:hypothetical protein
MDEVLRIGPGEGGGGFQNTGEAGSFLYAENPDGFSPLDEDRCIDVARECIREVQIHMVIQFSAPGSPQVPDREVQLDLRRFDQCKGFGEEERGACVPCRFPCQARKSSLWQDSGNADGLVRCEESDWEAVLVYLWLKFVPGFSLCFFDLVRRDDDHLTKVRTRGVWKESSIASHDLVRAL